MTRALAFIIVIVNIAAACAGCASTGATPRPFPTPNAPSPVTTAPRPATTPALAAGNTAGYGVAGTALSLRGAPYRNGGAMSSAKTASRCRVRSRSSSMRAARLRDRSSNRGIWCSSAPSVPARRMSALRSGETSSYTRPAAPAKCASSESARRTGLRGLLEREGFSDQAPRRRAGELPHVQIAFGVERRLQGALQRFHLHTSRRLHRQRRARLHIALRE